MGISRTAGLRSGLLCATAMGFVLTAGPGWAQSRAFMIPAQPASTGVTEFARQAGVQILVPASATAGKRTGPVQGALSSRDALARLLAGADLVVVSDDGQTITLGPQPQAVLTRARYEGAPAAAATSVAVAAIAQASSPPPPAEIEEVVITGSRLQAAGFTAPTPVTQVGAAEISQRSSASVFEVFRDIPSFKATSGPSVNSTGAQNASKANLDLRGLGSVRTLVLINGRRHVPDGQSGVFDTNLIPTSLIEQAEIVTGGASAAYGSDAVAGVVNFVLKNELEGFNGNLQYGVSQSGDNVEVNGGAAWGRAFADGRGHFIIGGDVTLNNGTGLMDSRDWGRLQPGVLSLSANRAPGLPATIISNHVQTSAYNTNGLITGGPLKGTAFGDNGEVYQFEYGSIVGNTEMIGGNNFDSVENPDQRLRPAYDRSAFMARAQYEITPDTTAFAQLHYGNLLTHGQSYGARIPNFNNYPVLIDNPFLPPEVVAAMQAEGLTQIPYSATRRDDLGSIRSRNRTETLQADFGVNGLVFDNWKWDIGAGVGRATFNPNISGTPRTADFFQSAYVVPGPNGPVCGPVETNPYFNAQRPEEKAKWLANLSPGCVPYNIFGANVAQNQDALDYFNSASQQSNDFRQYSVSANIAGELFELPAGAVSVATGVEWRKDTADVNGCPDCKRGALMNQNYPTYDGEISVKEFYAETGVPLLADLPFIESLDLNAAVRRTDYSTSGAVTTWKVGGSWELNEMVRVRATRSRDIRAPNINELFNPGSEGNPNVVNRVTGQAGFTKSNTIGNLDLVPETADTTTMGVVFQPSWAWAQGFRASIDYYDIEIRDVIGTLGVQEILDRLLVDGDTSLAPFVQLDPSSPIGISRVDVPQLNLNALKTNGVDVEVAYRVPLDAFNLPGRLDLRALGTWVDDLRTIAGTQDTDQAGGSTPTWSWNGQATYRLGRLGANLMVRYNSSIKYSATLIGPENPDYNPASSNSINQNIWPESVYVNTSFQYDFITEGGRTLQGYLNIDNLLDKDPPIVAISINGSPYDLVGRAFKLGVRFSY